MERLIASFKDYNIWESDSECLYELAQFVVKENYKRHTGISEITDFNAEILDIYWEELHYMPYSKIFLARDLQHRMIGSIRTMKWNNQIELPMQKIFGTSPLTKVLSIQNNAIWHIGRFAVTQSIDFSCRSLFKHLLLCAIMPAMNHPNGTMIAECDSKLARTLSILDIQVNKLGEPIQYLGSETIPINITRQGIESFFNKEYPYLRQKSSVNIEHTLSKVWNSPRINECA